ncbi:MAG: flagellar export chaperone FliS [Pseudomonadota bacterium]
MKVQRGVGAYGRVAVETADQKTLILICYDEAVKSLRMGKECYEKKLFEEKARHFIRAQNFITELLSSLNMEAGGEIAQNLSAIYNFCLKEMILADVNKKMNSIDDVIKILSELRSAWAQVGAKPSANGIPEQALQQPTARLGGVAV